MNVTNESIKEKIKTILCEAKDDMTLLPNITDTSNILTEVGLDSLQMINFILSMEDEFEVEINFQEFNFSNYSTINDMAGLVSSLLERSAAS